MAKKITLSMPDSPCRNCEACGKICSNSAYRTCPPFRIWFEERWAEIQDAAIRIRLKNRK